MFWSSVAPRNRIWPPASMSLRVGRAFAARRRRELVAFRQRLRPRPDRGHRMRGMQASGHAGHRPERSEIAPTQLGVVREVEREIAAPGALPRMRRQYERALGSDGGAQGADHRRRAADDESQRRQRAVHQQRRAFAHAERAQVRGDAIGGAPSLRRRANHELRAFASACRTGSIGGVGRDRGDRAKPSAQDGRFSTALRKVAFARARRAGLARGRRRSAAASRRRSRRRPHGGP